MLARLLREDCVPSETFRRVRPIALIHVLARVQARIRRPLAVSWERVNHRSYFWACAGRSRERAVWQQTVLSEWVSCKSRGASKGIWCSAQVLLDLLKAFEQVQHHWLLRAAVATGFPLWQLRLQFELHRARRFLALGSVVSDGIATERSVLPGDGWAATLLKLALLFHSIRCMLRTALSCRWSL